MTTAVSNPSTFVSTIESREEIVLALPSIHCMGCVSKIERKLNARPDVSSARVNLSLKRIKVQTKTKGLRPSIISDIETLGFEAKDVRQDEARDLKSSSSTGLLMRLGVSGFAMMNIMLLSLSNWFGAEGSTRDFLHLVSALIAIPTVAFAAQPFFKNAWMALSNRALNMDVPISLAIILATVMSLYEAMTGGHEAYFEAAVSLIFFLLAGRYLDHRTRTLARSAASDLLAMESQFAWRVNQGKLEEIETKHIALGDIIRIFPGQNISLDGRLVSGSTSIDCSALTGESIPEAKNEGDLVAAGTTNLYAPIDIEVTAIGAKTSLQRIANLIEIAENARTKYNSLSDKAARIYAPLVHGIALAGFLVWFVMTGDWKIAMNVAIATLIITCPCALGLAVPAVNTVASGRLFAKNILIKSETALERLAEIERVVFDKTGTMTMGNLHLREISGEADQSVALTLAEHSLHPLSISLAKALRDKGVAPAAVIDITEMAGQGIQGLYNGETVRLGRADWIGQSDDGNEVSTWLRIGNNFARFAFDDQPREDTKAVLLALQNKGLSPAIYSGDRQNIVARFAQMLSLREYQGAMTPEDKAREIANDPRKTLMVGDGINDAPALSTAHVSMSPGHAMDIAQTACDIVYLGKGLGAVVESIETAKSARKRILENFSIAAIYNLIAIPLALSGFAGPVAAAIAMSTSSIVVVLNAQRVRWKS